MREEKTKHNTEKRTIKDQVEKIEQKLADEEKKSAKYAKAKDEALNSLSQARQ